MNIAQQNEAHLGTLFLLIIMVSAIIEALTSKGKNYRQPMWIVAGVCLVVLLATFPTN